MRRPHATIKFYFWALTLSESAERAAKGGEREEDERISPPIDRTRRRRRTSDAREHATTSLVFGGWRSDDRESDDRESVDRKERRRQ